MGRKRSGRGRSVGFRMPEERYDLLARVAEARGVDVSAVLNQIVAEAAPELERWLEQHQAPPSSIRYLATMEETYGTANIKAVREVIASLPPLPAVVAEGAEELRRRADAHRLAAVRAAEKALRRRAEGVDLSAERAADIALAAQDFAAWDMTMALRAARREG